VQARVLTPLGHWGGRQAVDPTACRPPACLPPPCPRGVKPWLARRPAGSWIYWRSANAPLPCCCRKCLEPLHARPLPALAGVQTVAGAGPAAAGPLSCSSPQPRPDAAAVPGPAHLSLKLLQAAVTHYVQANRRNGGGLRSKGVQGGGVPALPNGTLLFNRRAGARGAHLASLYCKKGEGGVGPTPAVAGRQPAWGGGVQVHGRSGRRERRGTRDWATAGGRAGGPGGVQAGSCCDPGNARKNGGRGCPGGEAGGAGLARRSGAGKGRRGVGLYSGAPGRAPAGGRCRECRVGWAGGGQGRAPPRQGMRFWAAGGLAGGAAGQRAAGSRGGNNDAAAREAGPEKAAGKRGSARPRRRRRRRRAVTA
jgi:hypothetical protein